MCWSSFGVIMVPIRDSIDQECYLVTKHSWKGKYKRILAIGKTGVATYNPDKFDVTNRWPYSDVVAIAPNKSLQNVSPTNFALKTSYFLLLLIHQKSVPNYLIILIFILLCVHIFYLHEYCAVKPWVFIDITKRPEIWYN